MPLAGGFRVGNALCISERSGLFSGQAFDVFDEQENCPPGPMSALGGSGRTAPKGEVRVYPQAAITGIEISQRSNLLL